MEKKSTFSDSISLASLNKAFLAEASLPFSKKKKKMELGVLVAI